VKLEAFAVMIPAGEEVTTAWSLPGADPEEGV